VKTWFGNYRKRDWKKEDPEGYAYCFRFGEVLMLVILCIRIFLTCAMFQGGKMSKFEVEHGRGSKSCLAKIEEKTRRQGTVCSKKKKMKLHVNKLLAIGQKKEKNTDKSQPSPIDSPSRDIDMMKVLRAAALANACVARRS